MPPRTCHNTHGWEALWLFLGTCSTCTPGTPCPQGLLFQDKYLADMDELFSQVDEKRKVSVAQPVLL